MKEPSLVYDGFKEATGITATKIVGAIAAEKPFVGAMIRNVSAIIDEQVSSEFDMLRDRLVQKYPELLNVSEFASGFALRRYAYHGTAKIPPTKEEEPAASPSGASG